MRNGADASLLVLTDNDGTSFAEMLVVVGLVLKIQKLLAFLKDHRVKIIMSLPLSPIVFLL